MYFLWIWSRFQWAPQKTTNKFQPTLLYYRTLVNLFGHNNSYTFSEEQGLRVLAKFSRSFPLKLPALVYFSQFQKIAFFAQRAAVYSVLVLICTSLAKMKQVTNTPERVHKHLCLTFTHMIWIFLLITVHVQCTGHMIYVLFF